VKWLHATLYHVGLRFVLHYVEGSHTCAALRFDREALCVASCKLRYLAVQPSVNTCYLFQGRLQRLMAVAEVDSISFNVIEELNK
jgi:hypothetical protein